MGGAGTSFASPPVTGDDFALLVGMGEEPEVARIAAEERDCLRRGVPVDEEPLFDEGYIEIADELRKQLAKAEERVTRGDPASTDDEAAILAEAVVKVRTGKVKLGDLVPSDDELNAMSDEEQAWFAGLPVPRPRTTFAAPHAAPTPAHVPRAPRVQSRTREQRPRARTGSARSRSPGRPSADDDAELAPHARRKAVAA